MVPKSKSDASLLAGRFLTSEPAKKYDYIPSGGTPMSNTSDNNTQAGALHTGEDSFYMDPVLYTGRPADCTGRKPRASSRPSTA